MKAIQSAVISAGLLLAGITHVVPRTLDVGAVLPQLRGETLLGTVLILPDAVTGKTALLTITFSKKAGKSARAWSEHFAADQASWTNVTNYSIAMLEEAPRMFRGMIKWGIRKNVPPQAQDRFLIVTSDEAVWKKYLNVTDEDSPYLVLIDARGRVIWKDQGCLTRRNIRC